MCGTKDSWLPTGCGHANIVNTVRYAQTLTDIEKVYAIIGGFNLGGRTPEPMIQSSVGTHFEL